MSLTVVCDGCGLRFPIALADVLHWWWTGRTMAECREYRKYVADLIAENLPNLEHRL